jgi:hypothetical protein
MVTAKGDNADKYDNQEKELKKLFSKLDYEDPLLIKRDSKSMKNSPGR